MSCRSFCRRFSSSSAVDAASSPAAAAAAGVAAPEAEQDDDGLIPPPPPTSYSADPLLYAPTPSRNRVSFSRRGSRAPNDLTKLVLYELETAVRLVQACANAPFEETIAFSLCLNLDPRKPNQSIRTLCPLPHGSGRKVRVAVFCKPEKVAAALEAGADLAGGADLVEAVQAGKIEFERAIATPDMMAVVGKVARILGPRGLMPNPKLGTVTNDVSGAVAAARQGSVELRTDRFGNVTAAVGKATFSPQQIMQNVAAIVKKVNESKPSGAPRANYLISASLSSTRHIGVPLSMAHPPFRTRLSKDATSAEAPFMKSYSAGAYKVVRYDLGPHPSPALVEASKGNWRRVLQQVRDSRSKRETWAQALPKINAINQPTNTTTQQQTAK